MGGATAITVREVTRVCELLANLGQPGGYPLHLFLAAVRAAVSLQAGRQLTEYEISTVDRLAADWDDAQG